MNEALKPVAEAAIELVEYSLQVFEDGKVSGVEAFGFLPKVMSIPGILENKDAIKAEWEGRTTESLDDLVTHIQAKLDLPNKVTEAKVEKVIAVIVGVIDLIDSFKKPAEAA